MKVYLLSIIGPDRRGIVASISEILFRFGGNWMESRMARLGGSFTGIIRLQLNGAEAFGFQEAVRENLPDYAVELRTGSDSEDDSNENLAYMALSGQDQPGIVEKVFRILGKHRANVEELKTGVRGAPWSGQGIFETEARLRLSQDTDKDALIAELENLSNDLLVEIRLV